MRPRRKCLGYVEDVLRKSEFPAGFNEAEA